MIKYWRKLIYSKDNKERSVSYWCADEECAEIEKEKDLWELFPKDEFEFLVAVYEKRVAFEVDDINELPDVSERKPLGFRWVPVPYMCFTPEHKKHMLWHKDFGYPTAQ